MGLSGDGCLRLNISFCLIFMALNTCLRPQAASRDRASLKGIGLRTNRRHNHITSPSVSLKVCSDNPSRQPIFVDQTNPAKWSRRGRTSKNDSFFPSQIHHDIPTHFIASGERRWSVKIYIDYLLPTVIMAEWNHPKKNSFEPGRLT